MNAREIFDHAVELEPGERTAFLERACEPALRAEVRSLLAAHAHAERFLADPAGDPATIAAALIHDALRPGARLGRYTIVRLIGVGGMGAVYLAEQDRPRRTVALKVIRAGLADPDLIRRFELESQVLASLAHPGIAQVFDAGTHALGPGGPDQPLALPYFAMEHIPKARSLVAHADGAGLARRARLEVFARVCDAVQYAHLRGVIHRDLKPGNILVPGEPDAAPTPKIIDFGVARVSGPEVALQTQQTTIGQIVGTLRYMSPEQCGDDPASVDARSDVYALGVILYELLTGRAPYELKSSSLIQAPRIIREMPATRPSLIDATLRGDLETIILKALEKEPEARYQSAGALAEDIRRLLSDRPILARPPSTAYQLRTFARRNRALVAGVGATLAVLVLGAVGTAWQAVVATRERNLAITAERRANQALEHARSEQARAEWSSYVANVAAADSALKTLDAKTALASLRAAPEQHRNWEWRLLASRADDSTRTWRGPAGEGVVSAMPLPDGTRVLALLRTSELVMVDGKTFDTIWRAPLGRDLAGASDVTVAGISPDGTLACVAFEDDASVWDTRTGRIVAQLRGPRRLWGVPFAAFSPDGARVALSGRENDLEIYELPSGQRIRHERAGKPRYYSRVAYSPDASSLLVAQSTGVVALDRETLEERRRWIWDAQLNSPGDWGLLRLSRDGRYAFTHSFATGVVLDLERDQTRAIFRGHTQRLGDAAITPDGSMVATCAWDGTIRVWDGRTGECLGVHMGHEDVLWSIGFLGSPGNWSVVTSSRDGSIKLWDTAPRAQPWVVSPIDSDGWYLAWSSDSRRLLWTGGRPGAEGRFAGALVGTLSPGTRERTTPAWFPHLPSAYAQVIPSDDAGLVAYLSDAHDVIIWDIAQSRERARIPHPHDDPGVLALSRDGALLAVQGGSPTTSVWEVASGRRRWAHPVPPNESTHTRFLLFSPDGTRLLTAEFNDRARVLDSRDGSTIHAFESGGDATAAAWSEDGSLIAIAFDRGTVRIYRMPDGALVGQISGLTPACWSLGFSPDGTRLAVGVQDRTVRVIDVPHSTPLLTFEGFTGTPTTTLWSPDGRYLAVGCRDHTIRVWDASPQDASSTRAPRAE